MGISNQSLRSRGLITVYSALTKVGRHFDILCCTSFPSCALNPFTRPGHKWSALMIKIHHLCELRVCKAMEFWRFFHVSHSSYLFLFAECVWSLKVCWTEICSNYWRTSSWACLVLRCLLLSIYVLSVSQLHPMVFWLGVETCSWMSFCSSMIRFSTCNWVWVCLLWSLVAIPNYNLVLEI
jgi:hypothetical protein